MRGFELLSSGILLSSEVRVFKQGERKEKGETLAVEVNFVNGRVMIDDIEGEHERLVFHMNRCWVSVLAPGTRILEWVGE